MNDNNFKIQNKTSTNAYADRLTISSAGAVSIAGSLSASSLSGTLSGDGAGITNLNATNIASGALAVARGGTGLTSITSTRITFGGTFNTLTTSANLIYNSSQGCVLIYQGTTTGASTTTNSYTYFGLNSTAFATTTTATTDVRLYIQGSTWTTGRFLSTSDSRIKENIQDINDDNALQMILAIQPKTYNYIDKIERGGNKVYGFIAQQIREVIPEATTIKTEYIPDIMLLADYDNNIITLPSIPSGVIIKVNDKIKCYSRSNKVIKVKVVEVIDELTYKIYIEEEEDRNYSDNNIFVSGTEIDDFHTLDKSYIYTLNVCATQELHRRMEAQEERIKELETKMTDILKYLSL